MPTLHSMIGGFDPSYYLCIDGNDLRSYYKDINQLVEKSNIEKFFLYNLTDNQKHGKECFQDNEFKSNDDIYVSSPKIFLFNDTLNNKIESPCITDVVAEENTITTGIICNAGFVGMKMLYHLGYRRIVLVGMDARYSDDSTVRDVVEHGNSYRAKNDDDSNHFRKEYFGKNITFGKPNQKEIIEIWSNFVAKVWHKTVPDLEIISCTENSNLNQFINYIPFETFMDSEEVMS